MKGEEIVRRLEEIKEMKMLTVAAVRKQVLEIQAFAEKGDFEAAHLREDELLAQLVQAIAKGKCRYPDLCAQEALKSLLTPFERHCA